MAYRPNYEVNVSMIRTLQAIASELGKLQSYPSFFGNAVMRRQNRIRSIYSSLAIEGNQLDLDAVTRKADGKTTGKANPKDILELENAIAVYRQLDTYNPLHERDLLRCHRTLMQGLIHNAGHYRSTGIDVRDANRVIYRAPPSKQVPAAMAQLFDYLNNEEELWVIKSCVFHFEFELVHPFSDGNGRMGRLWQTLLLKLENPLLAEISIEQIILNRQDEYYRALASGEKAKSANPFLTFMLSVILEALREAKNTNRVAPGFQQRLAAFATQVSQREFSRKEYYDFHGAISTATASRDLRRGVDEGLLARRGSQRNTVYRFTGGGSNRKEFELP